MMVIELRKATQDKAFDILDEVKELGHQKKALLCELEDVLYECFESSEEQYEDFEREPEMDYRRRRSYRSGMRRGMHDDYEREDMHMRRGMRSYAGRRAA